MLRFIQSKAVKNVVRIVKNRQDVVVGLAKRSQKRLAGGKTLLHARAASFAHLAHLRQAACRGQESLQAGGAQWALRMLRALKSLEATASTFLTAVSTALRTATFGLTSRRSEEAAHDMCDVFSARNSRFAPAYAGAWRAAAARRARRAVSPDLG